MIPLVLLTVVAVAVVTALVVHARRHGAAATFDLLLNPDHQEWGDPVSHVHIVNKEQQ